LKAGISYGQSGKVNLGSVEVLPIDVLVRYQRRSAGRFHPYAGGGIAFSVFWEKSGMLDSTDLRPSAGPSFTAGFDYDVSPRVVFSTEFRARWLETEIQREGAKWATLSLNPSTLSVGMGFRF
jgi:outer membrane protein W